MRLLCTSTGSRPSANLTWTVRGVTRSAQKEVSRTRTAMKASVGQAAQRLGLIHEEMEAASVTERKLWETVGMDGCETLLEEE
ncbi:hypothetical protein E2C01_072878 [Portunus trituberculatus]|uniref:Ig-like domain-containing protein n=1 Tax=Portunus trituberculatus TaxID=210409 RepID=A0A5B7I7V4_PORTR|nr:hypothetical protein [Portunus trituberculatus]